MTTAIAIEPKISRQKTIQQDSLLEELYTYYSLSQLETMLENKPDRMLLQKWKVTGESLREELKSAIDLVKND